MKSIFIIISILILPITIYATKVTDVKVCKRVEGCKLIFSSETMETYCPTCVKESIIISPLAKPKRVNRSVSALSGKFDWIKWITKDYLKYIL
jgi:hypothetical protein